ncbi:tripartite tricarboxylate transporter substrate binding protein [Vibrio caribbeanicus]|uniref:tripartite tricarboxylate transporter substrate binding protein n=1 Tax=Vibrio caribbeanicus TaxID=701175 RepID=UPI0022840396|nr:tripartite tricarboxylate transporter substrate-binding protein [Vibrio caribbeanicus]MCY9846271.1 tripartite tricarboxylate transporter substrate-binding protein [Vibrio caribbeanicus]
MTLLLPWKACSAEIEEIHFLIPGQIGGGWDITARRTGEVLLQSGLIDKVSFENIPGDNGARAIFHLLETASDQKNTLLVSSTPIVIHSLTGLFPQSFHALTPIAATISDYSAIVTTNDSNFKKWQDVVELFRRKPKELKIIGGSPRGGMDHLVAASILGGEGFDPLALRYTGFDDSRKATTELLSGNANLLSTGLGEVLTMHDRGELRILAITAPRTLPEAPNIPTLTELGNPTVFTNWRGFFAVPGLPKEKIQRYNQLFKKMYNTAEWAEVRERNGWTNDYKPHQEFAQFLEDQRRGSLMRTLQL